MWWFALIKIKEKPCPVILILFISQYVVKRHVLQTFEAKLSAELSVSNWWNKGLTKNFDPFVTKYMIDIFDILNESSTIHFIISNFYCFSADKLLL